MQVVTANGAQIPALGFGTYGMRGSALSEIIAAALHAGFRHIDTAQVYENEADVGRGVAMSGIRRADVFLTTFDFELSADDMAAIFALAAPGSRIVDPAGLAPARD